MEGDSCAEFAPTVSSNADRGPTDKQSDASPLDEKMRRAIEDRVGSATSGMSQMKVTGDFPDVDRKR